MAGQVLPQHGSLESDRKVLLRAAGETSLPAFLHIS